MKIIYGALILSPLILLAGCATTWSEWDTYGTEARVNSITDPNNGYFEDDNGGTKIIVKQPPRKYVITPHEEEKYQALDAQVNMHHAIKQQ